MPRTKKKPRKAALRKRTGKPQPDQYRVVFVPRVQAGVRINHDTALTLSAVWACIRVISETIAAMPWTVMRQRPDGGRDREPLHPVEWMLHRQPNPEMTAFTFRETMLAWTLAWGNGYAEIERNEITQRPIWLWPITPDRVTVKRDEVGQVVYEVRNGAGQEPSYLGINDMFHLKGLGFDGLVGYSVISMAAESLGLTKAAETYGSSFFGNGAVPSGVLEHPGRLKEVARENMRKSWNDMHQGPHKAGRIAILEEGTSYKGIGMPAKDSQFLETRQHQTAEVARWFRVQLHKISDLDRATNNNISQMAIEFVTDTLMPWIRRLESEADWKLFGRNNQGTMFTKINVNSLLRGDPVSRSQFYESMRRIGVFSTNDILELEDRNPIGPDGDKRIVQINQTTLEKIGEEPVVAVQPSANGKPKEEKPLAGQGVVREAVERIAKREWHRMQNGLDKPKLKEFLVEHYEYAARTLRIPLIALAEFAGASEIEQPTDTLIRRFLDGHIMELSLRHEIGRPIDDLTSASRVESITRELCEQTVLLAHAKNRGGNYDNNF